MQTINIQKRDIKEKLTEIINEKLLYNDKIQIIINDKEIIIKPQGKKYSIMELRGIGKELWKNIDEKNYIKRERNSWE